MPPKQFKKGPENSGAEEPLSKPGMHPEFALRAGTELPQDRSLVGKAREAALRAQEDPDNPSNRPLLGAEKLEPLARVYAALAAGSLIPAGSKITGIEFEQKTGELRILDSPEQDSISPMPLLGELARQSSLDGPSREITYANVRLAHGLTAHALNELATESLHLSDKALASIQEDLQAILKKTIHSPLSSGLTRYQTAGLLNAVRFTITSDPVEAVLWENKDPIGRALERLDPSNNPDSEGEGR